MHTKLSAAGALAVAAAVATGAAMGGHAAAQQRIAITSPGSIDSGVFVLAPLTSGPIRRDSGTRTWCCWTRRFSQRDGQAIEIDNPVLETFKGKHGTFSWRAQVVWIDLEKGYSMGTGTWKILRGTGAYAHLEGHGRMAFVNANHQAVADRAEGLVDLGR
jgi:hypothetical protein